MNKNILIWILAMLLLAFAVNAISTTNLKIYYSMDTANNSGINVTDWAGNWNGTRFGTPNNPTGVIGQAVEINKTGTKYIRLGDETLMNGNNEMSLSFWIKHSGTDAIPTISQIIVKSYDANAYSIVWNQGKIQALMQTYPKYIKSNSLLNDSAWHFIVMTYNGSKATANQEMFVDGVLQTETNTTTGAVANTADFCFIGAEGKSGTTLQATAVSDHIDEVGFWNIELSQTEVTELYNGGAGLNPYVTGGGAVTYDYINLSSPLPANNSNFSVSSVNINASINSTYNFNYSFYVNGTIVGVPLSGGAGTNVAISLVNTYADGTYSYYIYAVQANDSTQNETTNTSIFNVHVLPIINFTYVNTSLGLTNLINGALIEFANGTWRFNTTVTDTNLVNVTYAIYNSTALLWNKTYNVSTIINISSNLFADFNNPFSLNITACDTITPCSIGSVSFNITDTYTPTYTGLANDTTLNGTAHTFNAMFYDEYLWSFYMVCNNGDNFSRTSMAVQSYNFSNTTSILTSNLLCSWNLSDGHTASMLTSLDSSKLNTGKDNNIIFDNIELKTLEPISKMTYDIKYDRVSFCYTPLNISDRITFPIPKECVVAPNSKYKGHIVCNERYAVDFENYQDYNVGIDKDNIIVYIKDGMKALKPSEICFNSIVELNTIYGNTTITLTYPSATTHGNQTFGYFDNDVTCVLDEQLPYVFGYFAIIAFVFVMFLINFIFIRIPFVSFLIGFSEIIVTLNLYTCNWMLGVVFTVFGLVIIMAEFIVFIRNAFN